MLSIGLTTILPTFSQGVFAHRCRRRGLHPGRHDHQLADGGSVLGTTLPAHWLPRRRAHRCGGGRLLWAVFRRAAGDNFPLGRGGSQLRYGRGLGLLSTSLVVGIQSVVGWNQRGVVTGSNMFARQLGQALGAAVFGGILNASLANWIQHAPSAFAAQLPANINDISSVLGGSSDLSAAALAYLRQGLYIASHQVFIAVTLVAVVGVVAMLWTPRRFDALTFAEEEHTAEAQPQSQAAHLPV